MNTSAVFNFQSVCSLFMFGLIAMWYLWPRLVKISKAEALQVLLVYSAFRYIGTFFMVPEITHGLDPAWANPAAYLDILSVTVALIAAFLLHFNALKAGFAVSWLYVVVGFGAFAHGGSELSALDVAPHIGAAMPVMTILGPSWMVTIVVMVFVLIKHPQKDAI